MSRRLSARPCTAGSCGQVAADDLERDGAPHRARHAVRPDQRRRLGVAATSARNTFKRSRSSPVPQVEQVAGRRRRSGFSAERPLECRRGEAQGAIRRDDQDDVRGIRDERGVARLDHLRGPPLTHPRIVAQHGALANHDQQREDEHDHRHHGHRTADLGARDVDEDEKADEHRRVRQAVHQRVRGGRRRLETTSAPPAAARARPSRAAGSRRRTARPAGRPAGNRRRPSPSAHRMSPRNMVVNPASSRQRDAPAAGVGQQQHAEGEHQQAVEREVALAERLLDDVDLGRPSRPAG